MAKALKGYKSFKIGAIAGDGGMGTTLTALGTTVKGSVNATASDATTQDFFIEEQTSAFDSAITEESQLSGTVEIYDLDPDTLVKVFGGTSATTGTGATTRKVFTPPSSYNPLEVSAELESKNGFILAVVRMQLLPVWSLDFQDEALGKVTIKWKTLAPSKADTAAYTLSVATPA